MQVPPYPQGLEESMHQVDATSVTAALSLALAVGRARLVTSVLTLMLATSCSNLFFSWAFADASLRASSASRCNLPTPASPQQSASVFDHTETLAR